MQTARVTRHELKQTDPGQRRAAACRAYDFPNPSKCFFITMFTAKASKLFFYVGYLCEFLQRLITSPAVTEPKRANDWNLVSNTARLSVRKLINIFALPFYIWSSCVLWRSPLCKLRLPPLPVLQMHTMTPKYRTTQGGSQPLFATSLSYSGVYADVVSL